MKKIILCLLLVVNYCLSAQTQPVFERTFGGELLQEGYGVAQDSNENYYIVGSTSSFGAGATDMYVIKANKFGDLVWQKTFGGVNVDVGQKIVLTADNTILVMGYTNDWGVGSLGGYDIVVMQLDTNGNMLWNKRYGSPEWDLAYQLRTTRDGGYLLVGETYSQLNALANGYILKLNPNGDVVWSKSFGGNKQDVFKSVIESPTGSIYVAGTTESIGKGKQDVWIKKLNPQGEPIAEHIRGGQEEDLATDITYTINNQVVVAGHTKSFNAIDTSFEIYHLRLDSNLNLIDTVIQEHCRNCLIDTFPLYRMTNSCIANAADTTIIYADLISYEGLDYGDMVLSQSFKYNILEKQNIKFVSGAFVADISSLHIPHQVIKTIDGGYAVVGTSTRYRPGYQSVFLVKFGYAAAQDSFYKVGSFLTLPMYGNNIAGDLNGQILGLNNLVSTKQWTLYPNPFTEKIILQSNKRSQGIHVTLYDIAGKELMNKQVLTNNSTYCIDGLENIAAGMYTLQIRSMDTDEIFYYKVQK